MGQGFNPLSNNPKSIKKPGEKIYTITLLFKKSEKSVYSPNF